MKWLWIILALIYLISPIDIIPGFHLPGWIDDIIVLALLMVYLSNLRKTAAQDQSTQDNDQKSQEGPAFDWNDSESANKRRPHEVLGVARDADQEEIRAAYRKLANQYHPDKVAHLGDEFQIIAEQRFKEIQQAYDTLKSST